MSDYSGRYNLKYNGNTPTTVKYGSTTLNRVVYNGNTVYIRASTFPAGSSDKLIHGVNYPHDLYFTDSAGTKYAVAKQASSWNAWFADMWDYPVQDANQSDTSWWTGATYGDNSWEELYWGWSNSRVWLDKIIIKSVTSDHHTCRPVKFNLFIAPTAISGSPRDYNNWVQVDSSYTFTVSSGRNTWATNNTDVKRADGIYGIMLQFRQNQQSPEILNGYVNKSSHNNTVQSGRMGGVQIFLGNITDY